MSYFKDRMKRYGLDKHITAKIPVVSNKRGGGTKQENKEVVYFSEHETGGINIHFYELTGQTCTFRKEGNKWPETYTRLRLHPSKSTSDQKYTQPKGSGVHIFLPPGIISKYQKSEKIETLYMTEGEFKAYVGDLNGLDIIGIPSISAYREKQKEELHEAIQLILKNCQVENLVMIYDADLLSVKWDKFKQNENYDLGKRFRHFYSSAINIRDHAKQLVKDVYLCNVSERFLSEQFNAEPVKGLDDLYLFYKGKEQEVTDELKLLRSSNKLFKFINISAEGPGKIREFFNLKLDKDKKPTTFYHNNLAHIGQKEFFFCGFKYKYNKVTETLEVVSHPDSNKFIRVACDFAKMIEVPENIRGIKIYRRKLEPWKSGEIVRDYVKKGFKDFFDTIKKYDSFTVYPDNTDKYKQYIDNCFNLYYPVFHRPEIGEWKTTEMFLNHLFGDQIEMIYDYLTLLYLKPHQPLPIIALASEERGTGKTKFLEYLREVFGENATILGNDAITDTYNDDYASKLVIGIDEGLIEKKAVVEKIKSWSTATRIKMATKFLSRQEIPFYGKIIITTNNVDTFIQIEDKETRFWIREVPKITKEDPDLIVKLIKEIPAFLHFLTNRTMKYEKVTRQWFANELLHTKALEAVKENSKGWLEKELKEVIVEEFYKYQYHHLPFTLSEVMDILNNRNAGAKFRAAEVRKTLEQKFKISAEGVSRGVRFPHFDHEGKSKSLHDKKIGRYYHLLITDFLTEKEVTEIGYDYETLQGIHGQIKSKAINTKEIWPFETPIKESQKVINFESENEEDLPF